MADITSWGFDENTIENYISCCCGILANALSTKLGWDVYQIDDFNTITSMKTRGLHYVVRTPEGFFIDIFGIWTQDKLLQYWYDYNVEMSAYNKNLIYSLVPSTEVETCNCDNTYFNTNNYADYIISLL